MPKSSSNENDTTTAKKAVVVGNNGNGGPKKRTRRSIPRTSPPQRSSVYRGVTRHRWTGRYEAHLWDKNCWNESQNKKGRQVYLGAYDDEDTAARAYDLAALKYWGPETILNFPLSNYEKEVKDMEGLSREEYIGSLRRKSSGFSRGVSKYRGVARHHHNGRWEARIGRVFGNKYLYLGTYATQEEAATAYDMAAIEYRGLNAVTNFDLSRYIKWLKPNNHQNNNSNTDHLITEDQNPNTTTTTTTNNISVDAAAGTITSNTNTTTSTLIITPNQLDDDHDDTTVLLNDDQLLQISHKPMTYPTSRPTTTTALGLLLQSSKFKEMMEMTSVTDFQFSGPLESMTSTTEPAAHSSFPEDIQTLFENQDFSSHLGGDAMNIFTELNSFVQPPMFHFDF